jgi:hypothetical protein
LSHQVRQAAAASSVEHVATQSKTLLAQLAAVSIEGRQVVMSWVFSKNFAETR